MSGAVDVDEAGYLAIALSDYRAWLGGGIAGWLNELASPTIQSPITTLATSVVFMFAGPDLFLGDLVPILFGAGTVLLTYLLARRIAGDGFGLVAALVVATAPIVVNFSRTYNFAMAATFFATAAMLCLVGSRQMRATGWAVALGVCVGLMVLARTVTVSFYPAVALAVLCCVFARRDGLGRAIVNTLLAGAVTLATAATWLAFSWRPVFEYLTRFGYGDKAAAYGPAAFWQSVLATVQYFAFYTQLTHLMILFVGLAALLAAALLHAFRDGAREALRAVLASPVSPVCIFALGSMLALMSSSNKGTGFAAPLFPSFAVVALYGLRELVRRPALRIAGGVLVSVFALSAAYPLLGMEAPYYRNRFVVLPLLGGTVKATSRAPIHWYITQGHIGDPTLPTVIPEAESRRWFAVSREVYDRIKDRSRPDTAIKVGVITFLVNGNTLRLANLMDSGRELPIDQSPPIGGTVDQYAAWIGSSPTCVVLSSPGTAGDIPPPVDTDRLEAAAADLGFTVFDTIAMPNGREIRLWSKACG